MRRPPLAAAMASLLCFSMPSTFAADSLALSGTQQARTSGASLAKAGPTDQVYLDQSFTNAAVTSLPTGWRLPGWNRGTVGLEAATGNLMIDGRASSSAMTALMLPSTLETLSNYRIDMEFTIDAALNNDATRWISVMYRASAATGTVAFEPYHQFAIRQNATANNGTEFALRRAAAWTVSSTKSFTEAIDKAKTYKATVVVHGNRVRQYLNGVLLHDTVMASDLTSGGVGIQTAGALLRVKNIKVTEQSVPLPDLDMPVAVQETETLASMAPTLAQTVKNGVSLNGSGVSNALLVLDSSLNLTDADGASAGTLKALFEQSSRNTIPLLRIQDAATVAALVDFSENTHSLADLTLLSADVPLLKQARVLLPKVRTAVDFTQRGLTDSTQDLLVISGDTNRAGAKIALLPAALTTRGFVSRLQRLLITVWSHAEAANAVQAAQLLGTGVNGVVSRDVSHYSEVLVKLPANTLLRKPLVIGHRGMPSRADENTLESAKLAVDAGADAVENDIYITSDGHLVIMHDTTVNRTTNGTGPVESMTLAQLKALSTKGNGYKVPTMREYFQAFKAKPITHVIELKSSNPLIISQLKTEIAEEGVAEQSVAISFLSDQLKRSAEQMPELTGGFLNSIGDSADLSNSVRQILDATQANSSTFNPSYAAIRKTTMEAAKHRGVTFWPWTINDAATFYKYYSWGTHGITTDHAYLASNFPVEARGTAPTSALDLNRPVNLQVELTTQTQQTQTATANELIHLGGTATAVRGSDGSLSFSTAGTAFVMPGYRHQMDATYSYVIMGQPLSLVVGDGTNGVIGTPNASAAGGITCSSAVPGQSSTCEVVVQPGYQLVGLSEGSNCPAGAWNEQRTAYTTGPIATPCEVRFDFAPLPASASLAPVGKPGDVQATVSGGGNGLWAFDSTQALSVLAAATPPVGVSFPYGLVSMQLTGGQPGQSATVELTYPEQLPANAKYYKFGKTADNTSDHWYAYPNAIISGNKVTLTLTDGQLGDNDLSANGSIRDPGGIALLADVVAPENNALKPVPTLETGALALLSAALGMLGWRRKRVAEA
ncbi:MAG: IPTL-CTERM sorting domain-containing protein [Comamonadaceae bacterium]|nr:IPTL-CTERM sorting domain-containing protein [Comamonadaceae bacterium]